MADEDLALLHAWRDGDRRAGSLLIDRYYKPIYRFFSNKAARPEDVEELAQRTFIGASEGLARFRGDASVRSWLFAIARNILRQWIDEQVRKRGREAPRNDKSLSLADLGVGASTLIAKREEQRLLLEALRHIPVESQLVLELSYWEQLTAKEIGDVLACPEGTARTKLRKAKQELQAALERLARSGELLESTVHGLDDWARDLRAAWG